MHAWYAPGDRPPSELDMDSLVIISYYYGAEKYGEPDSFAHLSMYAIYCCLTNLADWPFRDSSILVRGCPSLLLSYIHNIWHIPQAMPFAVVGFWWNLAAMCRWQNFVKSVCGYFTLSIVGYVSIQLLETSLMALSTVSISAGRISVRYLRHSSS